MYWAWVPSFGIAVTPVAWDSASWSVIMFQSSITCRVMTETEPGISLTGAGSLPNRVAAGLV